MDKTRGLSLLHNPLLNKGVAFTNEEREAKGLVGLLPAAILSLETQVSRCKEQFDRFNTNLAKYTFLMNLEEQNATLFFKFINTYLRDCLPIIYTPTVGEACQQYSHIFRRPQGIYICKEDKGSIRSILDNWHSDTVEIIVVSDGGRILGLGDLGLNGMGIPIGKLNLYIAGGGFDPNKSLPVMLDLGTNNEEYLNDPLYLGAKHHRLSDDEYYPIVEEFIMAVKDKWPTCLIQFEDFASERAFALLEMFRKKCLCFNDDIQGTGSVILTGFINALKIQKTDIKDVRVVFYGAGSAAAGCAQTIVALMESLGISNKDARRKFYMVDSKGLITDNRGDSRPLAQHKKPFSRDDMDSIKNLKEIIATIKPHMLMGLSGAGPMFKQDDIAELQKHTPNPVIFPLSNPTSKAEITAVDAYTWTNGSCIFAAGSPFKPVELNGKTYTPAQGNNMFIFPGVGLGAVVAKSTEVTDTMFIEAAKCLADMVSDTELSSGQLYPSLDNLQEISLDIAVRTMETAFKEGTAQIEKPADMKALIQASMWSPSYN